MSERDLRKCINARKSPEDSESLTVMKFIVVETCKSKNIQVFESARFFRTHRPFFSRCISGGAQPEG
ncbi:hypothetical protein [Anaerocolumna aminovalerica]|uniref:hypothetical protein n=1 Tax=Anaerocolumna aminovalerica TaxID=1527 RepID=UPI00159671E1|nr:hypothetical protein [Anaerocolumna aminovalerica]